MADSSEHSSKTICPAAVVGPRSIPAPHIWATRDLRERMYFLEGGPSDQRRQDDLQRAFRRTAEESVVLVSCGSSKQGRTVDEWLDRLRHEMMPAYSHGRRIENLLTASEEYCTTLATDALHGHDRESYGDLKGLAKRFADLRREFFDVSRGEKFSAIWSGIEGEEIPSSSASIATAGERMTGQPGTTYDVPHQRRKRGPTPDYEGAQRVSEIVARVAPDGDWRPKLDDICEALDQAGIPFPPRWRSRSCDEWADYDERANAVKAIAYRLKLAMQRKKTTPETLS